MLPDERDAAHLWDMLEYASLAAKMSSGSTFDAYNSNRTAQMAMERALEVVGEAARKVSKPFQEAHPEIEWRKIIAHRNVLTHDYGEIKQDRLWETATVHIPKLMSQLQPLVPELPTEGEDL